VFGNVGSLVIRKFSILPIFAVIIFSAIGYQEAYGITYQSTIGTGHQGSDNSTFSFPSGVAVDSSSGKIYVADEDNQRIQIFNSAGTHQSTIGVAGVSSPSDNFHLKFPFGVAVDSSGKIYVADTDNQRIQIFNSAGTHQSTIVGGGPGVGNTPFSFPSGVAVDSSDNIYVADTNNHRIQIFNSAGTYKSTIGKSGVFGSNSTRFNSPSGVAVDSSGNIYVADTNNHRIQIFNSAGTYKSTIGTGHPGSNSNQFNSPSGVAVDLSGNIYVADTNNQRIQIFNSTEVYMSTIVGGGPGVGNTPFNSPSGVKVDSSGNIYVADSLNYRVQVFSGLSTPSPSFNTLLAHSGDDPPPSMMKPSFGGVGNMVFADGITLDGKVYDLGNFAVNIPKNIADVGQPITIKIKEQLAFGPQDWKYVAVYMNFEGKNPETFNARLILSNDKNDGPKLDDPKGYVKDFNVTTTLDAPYVYTTFSFTAAKAMPDTTMIVSAWDSHRRVNNVYVGGAIQFGADPVVQPYHSPDWLHEYANVHDADFAIENAGYIKPILFAHLSTANQIWPESNTGHVLWFFDTKDKEVARVIYGLDGNMIGEDGEKLVQAPTKVLSGKDASYAGNHLDRTNIQQMSQAKKAEEMRALQTMESFGYPVYYTK
jgi:DNA-binding beta-propeller fold protein YncE